MVIGIRGFMAEVFEEEMSQSHPCPPPFFIDTQVGWFYVGMT
ncbi:MAG: hypothetical protein ABUK19_02105 [Desulfobacteria bacterium]